MKSWLSPKSLNALLRFGVTCGLVAALGSNPAFLFAGTTLPPTEAHTLAPMLSRVVPAVVNIRVFSERRVQDPQNKNPNMGTPFPSDPNPGISGFGSGVIVNTKEGIIVTNHHVVKEADRIMVTLDNGIQLQAQLIGADPESDLAALHVDTQDLQDLSEIKAIDFADSDAAQIGDFVIAIGNPFGLNQTVTSGIVSATGRVIGMENYEDFIQTDASINPGNSGGALINLKGQLLGINTAILSGEGGNIGIGFAIPSNMVSSILEQLLRYGKVRRGLLGLIAQTLTPELARGFGNPKQKGALVDTVSEDSLARRAGIQPGDIIEAVNDQPVKSASALKNKVGLVPISEQIKISLVRHQAQKTVSVTMLDPSTIESKATNIHTGFGGCVFGSGQKTIPHIGLVHGIEVLELNPMGSAAQQGLRAKDLILEVNQKSVNTVKDLEAEVKDKKAPLLLRVAREQTAFFMILKPIQR
jgi:serine protease Do/serine protease DegQ